MEKLATVQQPAKVLRPETVLAWCVGEQCVLSRFEAMLEGDRQIIHVITGPAVSITVPPGYAADIWDCFQVVPRTTGQFPRVCEATFRILNY